MVKTALCDLSIISALRAREEEALGLFAEIYMHSFY